MCVGIRFREIAVSTSSLAQEAGASPVGVEGGLAEGMSLCVGVGVWTLPGVAGVAQ
jgi:hypothetical protein